MGTAVDVDGLSAGIFRYGGIHLSQLTHDLIVKVWRNGEVPKDWRGAKMISIYQNARELCGN